MHQIDTMTSSTAPASLQTAVLFLVFNRPDTTMQVFETIRQARPTRLYVAADGPREGRDGEAERVAKVREIATNVEWQCDVKTLFRKQNLGCKYAVSEAITWFFKHEEQGIILEDDCLPHSDFFTFCETLLDRYADDESVSVITGDNFQNGSRRGEASYYFSKYNHCWGWASWRRAWQHYEGDLPFWPEWSQSGDWAKKMSDKVERRYWSKIFERVHAEQIDSWAYPWAASVWYHGGLTATPNVNLVSNIGFGPDSTHTASADSPFSQMAANPIGSIRYLANVVQDIDADRYVFDNHYGGRCNRVPILFWCVPRRIIGFIYRRLKGFFL